MNSPIKFPRKIHTIITIMKKTFFFNLFPTKAEEDEATANICFQVGRTLVEIRDLCPLPPPDPTNPWQIRKQPTIGDVATGRLILSHKETFEHIFRYWSVEMANYVLSGNKAPVVVWDVTEENNPLGYRNDNVYFERGSSEEFYVLGWMELARNRIVSPGDDIGLYWDIRSASFHFKVFQRQAQNVNA